jgi:hypothetical protein
MIQFRIASSSLEREKTKNIQQEIPLPLKKAAGACCSKPVRYAVHWARRVDWEYDEY